MASGRKVGRRYTTPVHRRGRRCTLVSQPGRCRRRVFRPLFGTGATVPTCSYWAQRVTGLARPRGSSSEATRVTR
jgi:hypothetical protein